MVIASAKLENSLFDMIAQEFINYLIPPLKSTDSVEKALNWMNQFRIHQLPVVHNGEYLGIISEETLYDANQHDAKIADFQPEYGDIYVTEQQHFYDVIKVADKNKLQIVAVVDEFNKFKGVITIKDTITALARTFATQNPGGIIVLSMREYNYSLAEISRLVESNNAKILSSYLESDAYDPGMVKVTLKLNKVDLSRVIATLERFGYNVIAKFQEIETVDHTKERLDLLFKYLDL